MRVGYKQIEAAREVNLIDFLESEYPEYIEYDTKTKQYVHPEHDSLKICETGFFRFSTNLGGDSIRYLQEYIGLSFPEAVIQLIEFDGGYVTPKPIQKSKNPYMKNIIKNEENLQELEIPKPNSNNNKAVSYLVDKRGLSDDTIQNLISQGLIYEDKKHNIIFINRKIYREFAIAHGTTEQKFHKVFVKGNDYWEFTAGNSQDVFITESPIDAISLYELRKSAGVENGIYIAMGGLKPNTVGRIQFDFPGFKIRIAPDWDEKGIEFAKKCAKDYKMIYLKPKAERIAAAGECKDWNELLLLEKRKREI